MLNDIELKGKIDKVLQWISDQVRNSGTKGVVIGNSGGKDSATVIALATKALGKENVVTIAMPCNSINKDLEDAKLVAKTFDVKILEIDLSSSYETIRQQMNQSLNENNMKEISKEADINIKPRLRMTTLYAVAQTLGYLVAGTGNLCERMVGYTTKYGDSACDFNPIGDFTVDEVIRIGQILGVPSNVINKAPHDGISEETDEEKMGIKYSQIAEYIETGKTDIDVVEKIENKYKLTKHKRQMPYMFEVGRKNLLENKM